MYERNVKGLKKGDTVESPNGTRWGISNVRVQKRVITTWVGYVNYRKDCRITMVSLSPKVGKVKTIWGSSMNRYNLLRKAKT